MTSSFSEDINVSLPGIYLDSIAWSDYNGDNNPDFLSTGLDKPGSPITKLYKNTGNGFSEDTSVSLPGVIGSGAWSDYNGDGKPDFLLIGTDYETHPITKLYKNTGSGFSEDSSISLPGFWGVSVAWSDYNGDSKPDLLLMGKDSFYSTGKFITKLYKNTGSGFIEDTSISISLPGFYDGSVTWLDYNSDNKPDFLLMADNSGELSAKLYKNTGSGFIEDTSFSLPGFWDYSSIAWSDYNGDGKPDFLVIGHDDERYNITKLYKNTASGFIEDTNVSLPIILSNAKSAWSDYTGDGKPDFVLTGEDHAGNPITKLYRNTGSNFIEDTSISLPGLDRELVAWLDYNSDGKPNLLLAGHQLDGTIIKLYKNTTTFSEAPIAISFNPADNAIRVPAAANLVVTFSEDIQKGSGKIEIKKLADDSVVETIDVTAANVTISSSQLTINPTNDLDVSTDYYVEIAEGAIQDLAGNNYAGLSGHSDWNFQTQLPSSFSEDTSVVSLPSIWDGSVAWSDYNSDNKPDFLLMGEEPSGKGIIKLYKNTSSGFSEDTNISIPRRFYDKSVAWSDYNGDNKPDLLLTGTLDVSNTIIKVYKNTGSGFSEDTSVSLPGVRGASISWLDYNSDNKSDFLLTGLDSSLNPITKLYKNTGSGFSEDTSVSLPGVRGASISWLDYNSDNKPDFLLTGWDSSGKDITKLYKNTGSGFSEDTSVSFPGVIWGSVTWSDYNLDNKPDFLLTGLDSSYNRITKLYKNTGNGFSEDTSVSFPGVIWGSVTWSDYNLDNKPDFLLTGLDHSNNPITKLYENTGNGFSEDTSISLPGVYLHSVAWSDYNGDNKPDVLLTGTDNAGYRITKLYKNITPLDQIAPIASSFTPADNATGIDVGANLVIDFSEAIQKGTGKIEIKKLADNSVVETIDVTAENITLNGSELTINPTNNLAFSTDYYVEISEDAIQDLAGNPSAGISGNSAWNFQTQPLDVFDEEPTISLEPTIPVATGFTPSNHATKFDPAANLVINFSEAIKKGSGQIVLKKLADNLVVETIDITAENITINGNQLTINPSANLESSTDYYLEIASGAIKDLAGNNYAGFTTNQGWNFQTADAVAPTMESFTPIDQATGVDVASNLVVNFNELIQKGTGKIEIKKLADQSVVETIDVTAANVTVNGNQLTINPLNHLEPNTDYFIEFSPGFIQDLAGNDSAGMSGKSAWNFQTQSLNYLSEDQSISLAGVKLGSVAWSDYNGDKQPDFLLTGNDNLNNPITKLYKNTGNGFSEETSIFLPGVAGSSVAWSDYNGDNKPDFLLTGFDYLDNPIAKLYKNTGSGFTEETSFLLPGVAGGSVAWSDYNGDNKPDLLLTGFDSSDKPIAKLYQNTGSGLIEDSSVSLAGVSGGSVAWSDYTGDNKADLILTGFDSQYNPVSKLYKNTGNGLVEDPSVSLPGVGYSCVAWSDYNSDGKVDLLLTGEDRSYNPIAKLYKNTGSGLIEDTSISLPGVSMGSVGWSDYNADNKPDLLLTGLDRLNKPIAKLYENTGNGFSEDPSLSLPGVYVGSVAWSDSNGDSKPDLLLTGEDSSGNAIAKLYHHNTPTSDPVETNLVFTQETSVNGTIGDDNLAGTANVDLINGLAGNDILTGGLGADQFIYDTNAAFNAAAVGVDTIADFKASEGDQILLDQTTFTKIISVPGIGFSVLNEFETVPTDALAASSGADIVYNTATGALFYNENGLAAGFGSGGQFLILTGKPELTESQFLIQE